jgi:diguanylate cyclase (GGDEF)-like protein
MRKDIETGKGGYPTAIRLFVLTIVSIFAAETAIMILLPVIFTDIDTVTKAFFDGLFLVLMVVPVLYLFLYRPLERHITERKRVEKMLHDISITDELTGLLNRRGFMTLAEKQLKIAEREDVKHYLLFIDMDDMKRINDSMGHEEGDRYLMQAADVLTNVFRESDIIGRIGGDEFAVLMIGLSEAESEASILERLEKSVRDANDRRASGHTVSLSTGVVLFDPKEPCSIDSLISRGDAVMYEHKKRKKNCLTER